MDGSGRRQGLVAFGARTGETDLEFEVLENLAEKEVRKHKTNLLLPQRGSLRDDSRWWALRHRLDVSAAQ